MRPLAVWTVLAAISVPSITALTEPVGASGSAGGGVLELTGYRTISPETTAGPVTVMVKGRGETAIKSALAGLSVVSPSDCVEVLPGFAMSVTGARANMRATWTWDECPTPGVIQEVVGGKAGGAYKMDCALHSAVLEALPKRAVATRRDLFQTRCS
jgi:hypothetical protein